MKRFNLYFAIAFAVTAIGLSGQSTDSPKWIKLSPSEFKDMSVYTALSDFEGKHYESNVYGRDLDGVAKWKPGDDLPCSMSKVIANAQTAFRKQFPQFIQFKIVSADLVNLPAVDDWVFNVEFNGTDFAKVKEGSFEDKKINVIVLLNGRAITPTEAAK